MRKHTTSHPSGIPIAVRRDSVLVKLMTIRRMKLERYAFLKRRFNPSNPKTSAKEKRQTIERKEIADELRAIERDCIRFLAQHTKDPEIYTKTAKESPLTIVQLGRSTKSTIISSIELHESVHAKLIRRWYEAKRTTGSKLNPLYRRRAMQSKTRTRHVIAIQIQDLEWKWLSALHTRLFPEIPQPPRKIVHPSRFKP